MREKELEALVDALLLKKARGEKLSRKENRVLAFVYYGTQDRCRCGVRR